MKNGSLDDLVGAVEDWMRGRTALGMKAAIGGWCRIRQSKRQNGPGTERIGNWIRKAVRAGDKMLTGNGGRRNEVR
jgi:hypothetical protein